MKIFKRPILISFLLSLLILIFPIISGFIIVTHKIKGANVFLVQGIFSYLPLLSHLS